MHENEAESEETEGNQEIWTEPSRYTEQIGNTNRIRRVIATIWIGDTLTSVLTINLY